MAATEIEGHKAITLHTIDADWTGSAMLVRKIEFWGADDDVLFLAEGAVGGVRHVLKVGGDGHSVSLDFSPPRSMVPVIDLSASVLSAGHGVTIVYE